MSKRTWVKKGLAGLGIFLIIGSFNMIGHVYVGFPDHGIAIAGFVVLAIGAALIVVSYRYL